MRRFRLCLAGALALGAVAANAQAVSFVYDLRLKEVAVTPLTYVTSFKVRGAELDISTFAGVTTRTNAPVVGGLVGKRFFLDDEKKIGVYFGAGLSISGAQNWSSSNARIGACIGAWCELRL